MPQVPRAQRQVGYQKAPQPQVESGFLTDEYRALARSGQEFGNLASVLADMETQNQARMLMNGKAQGESVVAKIRNNYADDDWLAAKFKGDYTKMAATQMKDYETALAQIETKDLSGLSQNSKAKWRNWRVQAMASLSRGANLRQYQYHEAQMELAFERNVEVEAAKVGQVIDGKPYTAQDAIAQLQEYQTAMPPSRQLWAEGKINALKGSFAKKVAEQQKAARRGQIDNLAAQVDDMEQQKEGQGLALINKLNGLTKGERTELKTRRLDGIARRNIAYTKRQLDYQGELFDREANGETLTRDDFEKEDENGIAYYSKEPKEREAARIAYEKRVADRASGKKIESDGDVEAELSTMANDISRDLVNKTDFNEQLHNAYNGIFINGKHKYVFGKNDDGTWRIVSDTPLLNKDDFVSLTKKSDEAIEKIQADFFATAIDDAEDAMIDYRSSQSFELIREAYVQRGEKKAAENLNQKRRLQQGFVKRYREWLRNEMDKESNKDKGQRELSQISAGMLATYVNSLRQMEETKGYNVLDLGPITDEEKRVARQKTYEEISAFREKEYFWGSAKPASGKVVTNTAKTQDEEHKSSSYYSKKTVKEITHRGLDKNKSTLNDVIRVYIAEARKKLPKDATPEQISKKAKQMAKDEGWQIDE